MKATAGVRHVTILVGFDDGDVRGHLGVEYEGSLWLVTAWLVDPASSTATPERMIRVGPAGQGKASPGDLYDYVNVLLPKSVVRGRTTEGTSEFEVRSLPDLPIALRSSLPRLPFFP